MVKDKDKDKENNNNNNSSKSLVFGWWPQTKSGNLAESQGAIFSSGYFASHRMDFAARKEKVGTSFFCMTKENCKFEASVHLKDF